MSKDISAKRCCGSVGFGLLAGAAFVFLAFLTELEIVKDFGRRK